ncbi:MAG TPA: enoyl-CoA hydratase-related protein [Acidimicrobiia bacterium]
MPTTLQLDTPDTGTVVVRLHRPERLNAIDEVMARELRETCSTIGADPAIRVVVLIGAGRGFCSGIDLRGFGPSVPDATAPVIDRLRFQEMMASLPLGLRELPQPVIAAVNGPAVGGGLALCLAADLRICSTSASFGNAAILLGLSGAEMGMSYHLPRIVGTSIAADWMLTARTVSAQEAYERGLVSELVDDDRLLDRALEIAAQIGANSRLGVQMTKRALQVNTDAPDLVAALELENRNQVITSATEEAADARAKWRRG